MKEETSLSVQDFIDVARENLIDPRSPKHAMCKVSDDNDIVITELCNHKISI